MSKTATAPGVVDRVQNFVSENKKAVLIGAAVAAVAIGGAAYYASTSGSEAAARKKEKKKSKSSKKRKGSASDDGPLLEEVAPKPTQPAADDDELLLTPEKVAAMSEEERTKAAASLKGKGNSAYGSRRFQEAVQYYTKAIEITAKPEPTYYSNRAACYMNMQPPKYDLVVEDCNSALALDRRYEKALNRRANAYEALGKFEDALRDFTALTIFEQFKKEPSTTAVERVLKKLAEEKAKEILAGREVARLPSHTFISAYFGAFRPRAIPVLPENPSTGDETLIKALQALQAQDFVHSLTLVNEALMQGISWDFGKAEALNLRGTFKFLTGDVKGAREDLEESIKHVPGMTQSWVKLASIYMEGGDAAKTFECFEEALKHKTSDPDIFYHRGQVLFIMNKFEEAANDYIKSTELDDDFVFSHIQLAVALYKTGQLSKAMETFRQTLQRFPQRSEPYNYYGELLLDQGRYADAVEKFEKAIEIENAKPPPMNVLALVNKGLALFQWKGDIRAAEQCCEEALRIDKESEAAVATLAQLSLQQNKIDVAVKLFEQQAELARSEPELVSALTYKYASASQLQFLRDYPEMATQLSNIAQDIARGA